LLGTYHLKNLPETLNKLDPKAIHKAIKNLLKIPKVISQQYK